jgi:O-antigen/teichoic acid export membrane protein
MACSLACSGYGVVAILVLLLGQGVLGSGIYFFLKIFRKGFIKKWKQLDIKEKKKERKRYWLTLLISSLAFWLFILLGNLLG